MIGMLYAWLRTCPAGFDRHRHVHEYLLGDAQIEHARQDLEDLATSDHTSVISNIYIYMAN